MTGKSTTLQTVDPQAANAMQEMRPEEVVAQVQLIQNVMAKAMKKNEHFGVIPGTNKPTLLKPGAEKLCLTFRLAPEYEEIAVTESDSLISYRIRCNLIHINTGRFMGSGLGTCNSCERKYKTRFVFPNKATDEEKAVSIRTETRTGKKGSYQVLIIPQDPWELQNTLYKMACKRALVAAILNATAASDIFTQDLEDMPNVGARGNDSDAKPPEKTCEEYCLFGKDSGKRWSEMSLDKLLWYQETVQGMRDDPKKSKFREVQDKYLVGINVAITKKEAEQHPFNDDVEDEGDAEARSQEPNPYE